MLRYLIPLLFSLLLIACASDSSEPKEEPKQSRQTAQESEKTTQAVQSKNAQAAVDSAVLAAKAKLQAEEQAAKEAEELKAREAEAKKKAEEDKKAKAAAKAKKAEEKRKAEARAKKAAEANAAKFEFKSTEHKYGWITEGEVIAHEFEFTNVGKKPLIIQSVDAACGCTIPEYPPEPTPPGASNKIKVTFDTKGKVGTQNKKVTIVANTVPKYSYLWMKGAVLK